MSRIGRMPIVVPAGVDVKIDGQHVTVKGGKAELSLDVHPDITVKLGSPCTCPGTLPGPQSTSW